MSKIYRPAEIGGGMNFKRKAFLSLMSKIQLGEIKSLIIAHKDRLVRFGFDFHSAGYKPPPSGGIASALTLLRVTSLDGFSLNCIHA